MSEVLRGKGIGRSLLNLSVAERVALHGRTLDVGGKGNPSYRRFLPTGACDRIVVLDLEAGSTTDVRGSLACLPLGNGSFDHVLCFNVLEHVFDFGASLQEMRRVLKKDGILYGYVPFLVGIHADPNDHWRYTEMTLRRILNEGGFEPVRVEAHGGALLVAFDLLRPFLRFSVFRLVVAAGVLPLDGLVRRLLGLSYVSKYPLGYFFVARSISVEVKSKTPKNGLANRVAESF